MTKRWVRCSVSLSRSSYSPVPRPFSSFLPSHTLPSQQLSPITRPQHHGSADGRFAPDPQRFKACDPLQGMDQVFHRGPCTVFIQGFQRCQLLRGFQFENPCTGAHDLPYDPVPFALVERQPCLEADLHLHICKHIPLDGDEIRFPEMIITVCPHSLDHAVEASRSGMIGTISVIEGEEKVCRPTR